MFAFIKKLFGRQPAAPASTAAVPATFQPPASSAAPPPAPSIPAAAPAPACVSTAAPAPEPAPAQPAYSKETVDLPLKPLWSKLPPEVTRCASSHPGGSAFLRLPLNLVQAHLARGGMKIPLAQFRRFSPADLFPDSASHDTIEVVIPISEILPRLRKEHLPRRAGQRRIEVPDDIEPIFGPKGQATLRIAEKGQAATAKPVPITAHPPAVPAAVPPAPAPAPVRVVAPMPQAPPAPIAPPQAPAPAAAALPAAHPVPPPPSPTPAPVPPAPELHIEPIRAPRLDPALATLRVPATQPPQATDAAPGEEAFTLNMMDCAAFWAAKGRIELEELFRHSILFPRSALQAALKKGKIEFLWRELKPWIRLASGNALPAIPDDTKVEFPLAVIAPRFLESQSRTAPRQKVEVSEEIPDVFVKHDLPAPQPTPATQAEPGQQQEEQGELDFGRIFGEPGKTDWSLREISQRASGLPGVAGAIIATSDGLLVGGKWPGAVGTEAVAAFVPQIFSRLAGYTSELKLGNPADFTLMVENVPLQIFKSADSYFTVLGRAGESLPDKELKAIATRLAATATQN